MYVDETSFSCSHTHRSLSCASRERSCPTAKCIFPPPFRGTHREVLKASHSHSGKQTRLPSRQRSTDPSQSGLRELPGRAKTTLQLGTPQPSQPSPARSAGSPLKTSREARLEACNGLQAASECLGQGVLHVLGLEGQVNG